MENFVPFLFFLILLPPLLLTSSIQNKKQHVYIVYFGEHTGQKTPQEIEEFHHSYIFPVKETTDKDAIKSSLIYSYKHSINGFAAFLTPREASQISEMDGVMSVFRSHPGDYSLHTTRSWEFSGLREVRKSKPLEKEDYLLMKSRYGKNVVVGIIDSGVWPESESFNDEGMSAIPKSWRGTCESGDGFNSSHCNKKIIGARYYIKGYEAYYGPLNKTLDQRSPRDLDGHGTHTASTAAGRRVRNVSAAGGFGRGTASGGAPLARLAIYKACWAVPGQDKASGNACFQEDILAAIDAAIADGVDVLSLSIGLKRPQPYNQDSIAIGTLHAAKRNIVVACSAGNSGPAPATLANQAPWIITVAASTVDRVFSSPVVLGNGLQIEGETVTPYKLKNKSYPLVFGEQCLAGSLSPEKAKGKIILCLRENGTRVGKGMEVKRAGGIGFILGNAEANGPEIAVDAHVLPATAVNYENALKIYNYIVSTKEPKAYIVPAKTILNVKPSPSMAAFSSRGPNTVSPDILKPDITAPGVKILAAWSEASSPTQLGEDKRVVKYNIDSGTSMSCPHVGAASALLKAMHPDWSSAAIRSALITSAGQNNNEGSPITDIFGNPADPFQFGSGHFRPLKAADPGLVYDASYTDYLLFLCSSGVESIDKAFKCPKNPPSPANLNYPSLAIPKLNGTITVVRTVTNVGSNRSVYLSNVKPPPGIHVKLRPTILYFERVGQKRSFTITVKRDSELITVGEYLFGSYEWSDKIHTVRSPMAVSVA